MEIDRIGGLPVVSSGKLVGIVTRTDILNVGPSKFAESKVSDVMSRELAVAYPEEYLFSALNKMIARGVGRLPVVLNEKPERLLGIVTQADIGKAIQKPR